jgi:hypothetical protein
MLQDKPTWIKLLIVCIGCILFASIIGLIISTFI